ncbi:MAG: hypothetical protein WCA34_07190, partial [Candidatus Acidiferrales bacterium]
VNLRKTEAFTAEKQRTQRKPKATAARFGEAEPAATDSNATSNSKAKSKSTATAKRDPSLRSG